MAITIQNHYTTFVARTGSLCEYFFYAEWSGNSGGDTITNRYFSYEYGSHTFTPDTTAESGLWYSFLSGNPTNIPVDVVMSWYPYMDVTGFGQVYGSTVNTKTVAIPGTASAPSVGSITASSASVSCDYVPNVTESTTSAQLQYKRTVDSSWTDFGSPKTDGTGYGTASIGPVSLTGLTHSTSYDVRLVVTRTTANDTTVTSSTTSFTTLVGEPDVTTDAAGSIAATSAVLNATVTINAGTNVTVYWKYGTDNPPTQNTTSSQSVSSSGSFNVAISGLTSSTPYFAQAYVAFDTPSGSPNNGSVVSFTTAADPAAEAANEDHMTIFDFNERKYGVASTFYFAVASPAATSSDRFFNAASPFVAGDVQISKDGGAFANVTNLPARIGTTAIFSIDLTAAEMQATTIIVQIVDQDGPAFRDAALVIRTKIQVGQLDVDASQLTNTSAIVATGVGSGHGISAVGGATGLDIDGVLGQHVMRFNTATAGGASTITLDASASATNDYYNGALIMIVGGTGAGQARVITDYVGGTQVATVNKAWATNPAAGSVFVILPGDDPWEIAPGAELAALPTFASSYAKMLQFLFQRFVYRRTMTATQFTMYKDDGTTSFVTAGVSDNGTTQDHLEVS